MALCWFSLLLEPSVAVKQSAIEFAHSGRTLNRKEGSGHSFWSYCLTTRLKQSNSSVAIAGCLQACFLFFSFFPFFPLVGTGEGGRGGWMEPGCLCISLIFDTVWWHLFTAHSQVLISNSTAKGESEWMRMYTLWKWSSYRLGFVYECIVKIGSKHLSH